MARYCKSIELASKRITKKGKLKGRNKKETKMLKDSCMHHKKTKRGRVKPTIFIEDDECVCTLCKSHFPAKFQSKEDIKAVFDDFEAVLNQLKYLAVATNAGNAFCDNVAEFCVKLRGIKKGYNRTAKIAKKTTEIKRKKKKKGYSGSDRFGSWSSR